MSRQVQCPNPQCGKRYSVSEAQVGRMLVCQHCGRKFTVSARPQETCRRSSESDTASPVEHGKPDRLPGQLGRFQIRSRVGAGAAGAVYRAYDPLLDREVALKVARHGTLQTDEEIIRFLREPGAAAQLRHPNIVPLYEAGVDGEYCYIASAFLEGRTLQSAIQDDIRANRFDFRGAATLVMELARALHYAHRLGLVHRNVQPNSVMVDSFGTPLLMDFGSARLIGSQDKPTTAPSMSDVSAYMSPEQASGRQAQVGPASDQYSLGVVLYELLCGKRPFSGPAAWVISSVLNRQPPSLKSFNPRVPEDLEAICLKAMAKNPRQRFADCGEFADDLRRWLEGEPTHARPLNPAERLRRWRRRNPALAKLTMASALLLVMLILITTLGVTWTSWALVTAREQETLADEALQRESQARAQAESESQKATAERDRVERLLYTTDVARAYMEMNKNPQKSRNTLAACSDKHRHWEWGYLMGRLHRGFDSQRLLARSDAVLAVAFSPDGSRIASASEDKTIKIWDPGSGQELRTLTGHAKAVTAVAFSPDGTRIASASEDQTIKIWNADSGQDLATLQGHAEGVNAVAFSPDGMRVASAGKDKTIKIWEAAAGKELRTLSGHSSSVTSVAFSPDGARIASASEDRTIKVWDQASGQDLLTLRGHSAGVLSVAFSPDGKRIVSASQDQTLKLWNSATGEEVQTLRGHAKGVSAVAFSSDGERIISGGLDNTAKIWDAVTGQVFCTLRGHTDAVRAIAFHPKSRQIASAGLDKTIRLWNAIPPEEWSKDGLPKSQSSGTSEAQREGSPGAPSPK